MTRYQPLWQQVGSYAASQDRSLIGSLWPSGGATGGVVSAVANTMTVSAAPGTVAVPLQSGAGCALCRWDANETPTIATAPPTGNSRIDLVIVQVRDNALDAGANNDFIVTTVTGTPAASNPAVPATPTNALVLATVLVPGAAANLNGATLTDVRAGALAAPSGPRTVVYRTGAWSTVATTATIVPFDTLGTDAVTESNPNLWTMATALYRCPIAGRYLVDSVVNVGGTAAGQYLRIGVYRNGTICRWGPYNVMPSGLTMMAAIGTTVRCAVGDTLGIYYLCSTALAGGTSAAETWAIFEYLGA
jgi:hypothetical protein